MSLQVEQTAAVEAETASEKAPWYKRLPPELPIFLFFALVAVFLTWPLVIRFNTSIYGFPGDNMGAMWSWWWLRNASSMGSTASFCPLIGFPFGAHLNTVPVEPVVEYGARFLLLFTNEVIVHNLLVISSFLLSGITMYYLVRHLTHDRRAAFFGGFAYMVCAYHAYHAMFIPNIAITQWMPLYILMLLRFIKRPDYKNASLLALSGILVLGTNLHYGMFMGIFTVAFLAGRFIYARLRWRRTVRTGNATGGSVVLNKRTLVLAVVVVIIILGVNVPFFYRSLTITTPVEWETGLTPGMSRTLKTAYLGSAKPYDYVLPEKENFLLGKVTEFTEELTGVRTTSFRNSLYLGWTVLALAIYAVVLALRRDKELEPGAVIQSGDESGQSPVAAEHPTTAGFTGLARANIWGFVLSAFVAFILSMPPYVHVGSVRIPLPSTVFQYIVPWFRWYMRFGIVVILCFIALACFGLSRLLDRVKRVPPEMVLVPLILVLFLEMTLVPPFRNFDFEQIPEVYERIAEFPDTSGLVIYPALERGLFNSQRYLFYQRSFVKPMLNGAMEGSDGEALRRTVYNPYNPSTPGILKRFDIDHVVYLGEMFEQYEGTLDKDEEVTFLPPGLRLVERVPDDDIFGDAYILEVTAAPADLVPIYEGGITVPRIDYGRDTVRLVGDEGVIKIVNYSGGDTRARVRIPIGNLEFGHRVTLSSEGEVLWSDYIDGDQEMVIDIPELHVPEEGVDLLLAVQGASSPLVRGETSVFGVNSAKLKIGDVILELL